MKGKSAIAIPDMHSLKKYIPQLPLPCNISCLRHKHNKAYVTRKRTK